MRHISKPVRSQKYLASSRLQPCTLRIPGVCNGDVTTTVAAHIRDRHKGGGTKASDISVANACHSCHAKFDGQLGAPLSEAEWLTYALRGLQETLEQRIEAGLLIVPLDVETPMMQREIKPRKDRDQRAPIQSRPFPKRLP